MERIRVPALLSLLLAVLCPEALAGTYTALEAYDLRVDGIAGPMGIDSVSPQFSWKLRAPPES
ncbi:MAG TPA: hypothetical protein VIJ19_10095, partial [Opitutaceae bacterium]